MSAVINKVSAILAPITPSKIIKSAMGFGTKLYNSPYATSKEIVPARIFNLAEKAWMQYGTVGFQKCKIATQASSEWIKKTTSAIITLASATVSFVYRNVALAASSTKSLTVSAVTLAYTKSLALINFAQLKASSAHSFIHSKVQGTLKFAFSQFEGGKARTISMIKSFSGKAD